ncbi:hypothetical protein GCM10020254_20090 [Streptomyces goshikiensis]
MRPGPTAKWNPSNTTVPSGQSKDRAEQVTKVGALLIEASRLREWCVQRGETAVPDRGRRLMATVVAVVIGVSNLRRAMSYSVRRQWGENEVTGGRGRPQLDLWGVGWVVGVGGWRGG